MKVWTSQTGWSPDCQVDGKMVLEGEPKDLFENTDGATDAWIFEVDMIDGDDDNDGIGDADDPLVEDADPPGTEGNGKPDWWERKKGLK